jgi:16S rRNA (cytidine1402-2'-O)-methyltransferase
MSKLYVIPTPIGNLKDITTRSLDVLKSVDIILAEDTRNTGKLLKHYDISTRMLSHHQNNEHKSVPGVINLLNDGNSVALVSDAGMPGISDPGYLLIRECIRENIPLDILPGPSALLPALLLSGLPCDRFVFEGFLPHKKGRMTRISQLSAEHRTMVFYESPHRIRKTLEQLGESFGVNRIASVSRELSKLHEETIRGTLFSLAEHFKNNEPRGEIVLVVEGNPAAEAVQKLN